MDSIVKRGLAFLNINLYITDIDAKPDKKIKGLLEHFKSYEATALLGKFGGEPDVTTIDIESFSLTVNDSKIRAKIKKLGGDSRYNEIKEEVKGFGGKVLCALLRSVRELGLVNRHTLVKIESDAEAVGWQMPDKKFSFDKTMEMVQNHEKENMIFTKT